MCISLAILFACQANPGSELENDSVVETSINEPFAFINSQPQSPGTSELGKGITELPAEKIQPANLWDRMREGFQLGEYYDHPAVTKQLNDYADNQYFFDLTAERAAPFLFWIIDELEQRDLPLELALLPFVESTFDPNAYSSGHAVGLWQIMSATGTNFGLQQDWWYDARRDPRASTMAALDYLQGLYQEFDQDWLLALAAYNTGDGNMRRALRKNSERAKGTQFWDLPLPAETRSHVPKILALARLIRDNAAYSIVLPPIGNEEPLTLVEIGAQIDLSRVAALAEMDYAHLRALNPGYLQWATHPDSPQTVVVPNAHVASLLTGLQNLAPNELFTLDRYLILPGDTLSSIAKKLGTRVDVLQRLNNLSTSRITAGRSLTVPRSGDVELVSLLPVYQSIPGAPSATLIATPASYTVRAGDNLWSIARRFDLKSKDIASWSQLDLNATLRTGQILTLQNTGSIAAASMLPRDEQEQTYLVRRGDSMAKIASRFNANLSDLLSWNNIASTERIYPGQLVKIQAPQNGLN